MPSALYESPPKGSPAAPIQDLTFFTNEPEATLLDRFRRLLLTTRCLDIIVGYFRVSGFHLLHDALEGTEKVRVLVGISTGRTEFEMIDAHRSQGGFDFASHSRVRKTVRDAVTGEVANAVDDQSVERGLRAFVRMLEEGRLEVKAYPTADLHAKVYVLRHDTDNPAVSDYGRVITGSSNFSRNGLVAQREFNVELKNRADVDYALDKFEVLWADAVPVTEDYVQALRKRTWLDESITPRELYLKFLYEYFREEINMDQDEADTYLPPGFMELSYQKEAVASARRMLEAYGGVFIADVVGLGKTFITALLAQQVGGRFLVICPPVLKDYWRDTFFEFGVPQHRIESLGKLEHLLREGVDKYDTVIIDEAHRFRNEGTQSFEMLHEICWGKRVVLVSATPLNNTVADLFALLKLFQAPRKSTVPGVPDLEAFFREKSRRLGKADRRSADYVDVVKQVSDEVRDRVLKHVMVRRTRREIQKHYASDLEQQGLFFPELAPPRRIFYRLDDELDALFDTTIERLKDFSYARYTPLLYQKKQLTALQEQSQKNVGGFMKGLLVKRLESSFYAFRKTLGRAVRSHERFLEMLDGGSVYVSKDVSVYDLLDSDRADVLDALAATDDERVKKYRSDSFRSEFGDKIRADLALLRAVQSDWMGVEEDPKLDAFVDRLQTDKDLSQRVLVFTESKETADYLRESLAKVYADRVLSYSSQGGVLGEERLSVGAAREMIQSHFDPNKKLGQGKVRILITTDVLAEGINLHRGNVVVNYDLPWNPTRVLQRVGRVNRVGTEHDHVFVYNFFPTDQSEEHIGLEAAVKAKIQAFHDALGEDAKYLTEDEEVSQQGLFGDRLFRELSDKETYEGQPDAGPSELDYLDEIRTLRDHDPETFERVKRLPKKARLARDASSGAPESLLTFFRRGRLKKFFLAQGGGAKELTFFDAAERFRAEADESARRVPDAYYGLLESSKQALDQMLAGEAPSVQRRASTSNAQYVLKRLKDKAVRRCKAFTEDDDETVRRAIRAFDDGVVAKATAKKLKDALKTEIEPLRVLALVRRHVPAKILADDRSRERQAERKEVVLSEFFGT
jgi:superfamily II DNA/RNA helicase/HKD family nuclease